MYFKGCYVIVNYNGALFLKSYFKSIYDFVLENSLDLYVADDNSTDGSTDFFESMGIKVIKNKGLNKGYAANTNFTLKYLLENQKYDFIIIANNDISISNYVSRNFKNIFCERSFVENYRKIGVIGFREVIKKQSYMDNGEFENDNESVIKLDQVNNVPGFIYLVFSNVFDSVGFFDETYFMYGEETDFFHRLQKKNMLLYNSNLKIFHFSEGASTSNYYNSWLAYRNAIYFGFKNLNIFGIAKIILSLLNQIYNPFLRRKNDPSYIRIVRSGFIRNNYLLLKSIYWNFKNK